MAIRERNLWQKGQGRCLHRSGCGVLRAALSRGHQVSTIKLCAQCAPDALGLESVYQMAHDITVFRKRCIRNLTAFLLLNPWKSNSVPSAAYTPPSAEQSATPRYALFRWAFGRESDCAFWKHFHKLGPCVCGCGRHADSHPQGLTQALLAEHHLAEYHNPPAHLHPD